jgi:hypothetical protein
MGLATPITMASGYMKPTWRNCMPARRAGNRRHEYDDYKGKDQLQRTQATGAMIRSKERSRRNKGAVPKIRGNELAADSGCSTSGRKHSLQQTAAQNRREGSAKIVLSSLHPLRRLSPLESRIPPLPHLALSCLIFGVYKGGGSPLAGHTYREKALSKPSYPGAQAKLTPVNC